MVISNNIKNILKFSFAFLLLCVLGTFATDVASAKTINMTNYVGDSVRGYLTDMYSRSEYKYGILTTEYIQNNYSYSTYYYLCLTNDKLDLSTLNYVNANCDKLYRYYSISGSYNLEVVNEDKLIVNGIYYYLGTKDYLLINIATAILIAMLVSLLTFVIMRLFV